MNLTANLRTGALAVALVLSGCAAPVTKVETGASTVLDRLVLDVDAAWNQFDQSLTDKTPTWTIDGVTIDALQFWVGVKDGALIAPTPSGGKGAVPLAFRKSMQPEEVVALYRGLWTRDGSNFTLDRLEPAPFLGANGFRFRYTLLRKADDVRMKGIAWALMRDGELFVIHYTAPQLGFFDRHLPRVEALVRSARLKG